MVVFKAKYISTYVPEILQLSIKNVHSRFLNNNFKLEMIQMSKWMN
jgi:hypothetical protein